jgi:hypothetical protein
MPQLPHALARPLLPEDQGDEGQRDEDLEEVPQLQAA